MRTLAPFQAGEMSPELFQDFSVVVPNVNPREWGCEVSSRFNHFYFVVNQEN